MSDTELLDGIAKYGISLWPDRESRTLIDAPISEWNTFARAKPIPVQVTRANLRDAIADTIKQLRE
jgi:hypothetical protein